MSEDSDVVRVTPERALVERIKQTVQVQWHAKSYPLGMLHGDGLEILWEEIAAFAAEYAREQVAQLKEQHASDMFNAGTITGGWVKQCEELRADNDALQAQVTALREAIATYLNASSRLYVEAGHTTTPKARAKAALEALLAALYQDGDTQ